MSNYLPSFGDDVIIYPCLDGSADLTDLVIMSCYATIWPASRIHPKQIV